MVGCDVVSGKNTAGLVLVALVVFGAMVVASAAGNLLTGAGCGATCETHCDCRCVSESLNDE